MVFGLTDRIASSYLVVFELRVELGDFGDTKISQGLWGRQRNLGVTYRLPSASAWMASSVVTTPLAMKRKLTIAEA